MASPAPSIIRVIDLETTGQAPPAHGVCEIGWQDVALQRDGRWEIHGEGGSRMVNPGRQIPPLTMAVHHIRDEDVADAPWWHDVARPVLYHNRSGTCWQPYVRGYTPMINSIYNGMRMEEVWLDR